MRAEPALTDGRNLRRDRNRRAVVDAVLELYSDGVLVPSAEQIAERAGTSVRSVFRYFDDVDDLMRVAISRQQERLSPLWALGVDRSLAARDRVDAFVATRVRLLDAMGDVGRVARMRAPVQPLVAAELARIRGELRRQTAEVFAPELADLGEAAAAVLATLDVMTSWEAYDLLRHDQGLDHAAATSAMSAAVVRLLGVDG